MIVPSCSLWSRFLSAPQQQGGDRRRLWPMRFVWCLLLSSATVMPRTCHADTLSTLFTFSGPSEGVMPTSGLIQARDGSLYGTTYGGGASGSGAVYRITTDGVFTPLYRFSPANKYPYTNLDGENPIGLIQAKNGNLYGIASWGGANNNGTVFKITTDGTFTVLYTFSTTGGYPYTTNWMAPIQMPL